jgi:hypothetical protein
MTGKEVLVDFIAFIFVGALAFGFGFMAGGDAKKVEIIKDKAVCVTSNVSGVSFFKCWSLTDEKSGALEK